MTEHFDVVICGGGLAGLCLARQLGLQQAHLRVAVIEKARFPVAEAAHKVGESSVEIGAHYFAQTLQCAKHIEDKHLPKLGLRYFFTSDDHADLVTRAELGGNDFLPARSYQLDRGRLENYLADGLQQSDHCTLFDDTVVRDIQLAEDDADHVVAIGPKAANKTLHCRWLVDASGRTGFLRRRLNLHKPSPHTANAAWFRINDRIQLDHWADDEAWRARHHHQEKRWLSTNHLMGEGYWVWFIPLGSGSTSVGIVAADEHHAHESIANFDAALNWLDTHEPRAAAEVRKRIDLVQDFRCYKDYSHDCERLFGNRWALVGEAGFFLDPFYSPGSDFIGIGNTLTAALIERDKAGEDTRQRAQIYNGICASLFANHLNLYHKQYGLFANAKVMASKIVWDFSYYWAIPASFFFHDRMADLTVWPRVRAELSTAAALNEAVQALFRAWHAADDDPGYGRYVDVPELPLMRRLNERLLDKLDARSFITRVREDCSFLSELGAELADRLVDLYPDIDVSAFADLKRGPGHHLDSVWAGMVV